MSDPAPVGTSCDLAICGGGMVGASLALALAPLDLSIVLIEATAPGAPEPPSFDERTTALANGSVRTYRALGVWRDMEREATRHSANPRVRTGALRRRPDRRLRARR